MNECKRWAGKASGGRREQRGSIFPGRWPLVLGPLVLILTVSVLRPAPGLLPGLPRDLGSQSHRTSVVGWGRGGGAVFFSPAAPGTQLLGGCHPELRVIPNREGWRSGVVAGGAVAGEEGAPRGCQRPGRQVAEPRAGAGSGVPGASEGAGPAASLRRLAPPCSDGPGAK